MPNLADDIFDAPLPEGFTVGDKEPADVAGTKETEPNDKQDVDLEGQGEKEHQPATSGEEDAKEKSSQEEEEQSKPEGEKKKRDGAAEARAWGEKWKASHDEIEAKYKEVEPLVAKIEEKFGGEANLDFAAEIYGAIADPDNFDANDAWEFLSENVPDVAEKMVQHLAKNIVERADKTAIKRTFGRDLSPEEVSTITDFLAAGKPATRDEFTKFFQDKDIPEALKYDRDGNEIPTETVDFMRRQQALLNQTQEKLQQLEGRMNGAENEQQEAVAAAAVEKYVGENFKAIEDKITDLGLSKALEGETADIKEFREMIAGAFQAVTLFFIGKDSAFQPMYHNALSSVAKAAVTKGKDRVASAKASDFSRRIQAKVKSHAGRTAELFSPLIDALAAKRGAQVETATKGAKTTPKDSPGIQKPKAPPEKKPLYEVDPFDDVNDVVSDMRRRGELKTL